jgi:hypothetical protein
VTESTTGNAELAGRGDVPLHVEVSRGFEEVSALESQWRAFGARALTADYDHLHAVIASEPKMLEPAVLTVRRGDALEGMVLGRIEDATLGLRLGYRTVLRPTVHSLTIVYNGFLGRMDDEVADVVVDELVRLLGRGGPEAVIFRRLNVHHPVYRAATTRPRLLVRERYTRVGTCWERSLPSSFDAFLASLSKSTRTSVKRYANKLERDYSGRLETRKLTTPADLDVYFRDADTVASKSYQRGLGVGVRDDPAQRRRAQVAAEHGWFRAYVLYVGGQPVAFCGGEAYAGRFYYSIPGYDPSFREHRVGQYVLMKMIEDLCEDESVHVLDFGPGDAEYKRRFGDRTWHEADVHLFAARPRPIAVNLSRTAILRTNDALASAARSLRVFGRIKQGWRRRAASPPA